MGSGFAARRSRARHKWWMRKGTEIKQKACLQRSSSAAKTAYAVLAVWKTTFVSQWRIDPIRVLLDFDFKTLSIFILLCIYRNAILALWSLYSTLCAGARTPSGPLHSIVSKYTRCEKRNKIVERQDREKQRTLDEQPKMLVLHKFSLPLATGMLSF